MEEFERGKGELDIIGGLEVGGGAEREGRV